MTPIFKGILWIAFLLALLAVGYARAEDQAALEAQLEGVSRVYPAAGVGTCWFDKNSKLTFDEKEHKSSRNCVVGMKFPDITKHYLLLGDQSGPTELLLFDETDKSQVLLWRKGSTA